MTRFVRLIPGEERQVSDIAFTHGESLDKGVEYANPFAFWVIDENRGPVPIPLQVERAVWRDSAAIFSIATVDAKTQAPFAVRALREGRLKDILGQEGVLNLVCIGIANDQANSLLWRRESIPGRVRLMTGEAATTLESALGDVEAVWQALRSSVHTLAKSLLEAGGKSADKKVVEHLQKRFLAKHDFWGRMESQFHAFLRDLDDAAQARWCKAAKLEAGEGLRRASQFVEGNAARVGQALVKADRALFGALSKIGPPTPSRDSHLPTPSTETP